MTDEQEADIRARDQMSSEWSQKHGVSDDDFAHRDRRALLAELDALRGVLGDILEDRHEFIESIRAGERRRCEAVAIRVAARFLAEADAAPRSALGPHLRSRCDGAKAVMEAIMREGADAE